MREEPVTPEPMPLRTPPLAARLRTAALLLAATLAAPDVRTQVDAPRPLGGPATVADTSPNAFGFPAPLLDHRERRRFLVGNSFFKQNWIESLASATGRDGLGPLFNARSCSACHLRDGRSEPPAPDARDRHGLLMRIGARRPNAPDAPHPHYGAQVQDAAVQGVAPEARVVVTYRTLAGSYGDGQPFELLQPDYTLDALAYGELGSDVTLGPRTAPQIIGLGLLEAVPVERLEALADPDDADGDGISGRVHRLDGGAVGRFGWKATQATVRSQTAAAFVNDIGITSVDAGDEELSDVQRADLAVQHDEPEIGTTTFEQVVFYTQALAVPAQRDADDDQVRRGEVLFSEFGCARCHQPTLVTGDEAFVDAYRNQTFHPFTDLLLHDMGPALADDKRDGDARPNEWRTPPLWGIGLLETVSGHCRLLHDGRARGVAEAILWHGGEGEAARERFRCATASERAALVRFVRSL